MTDTAALHQVTQAISAALFIPELHIRPEMQLRELKEIDSLAFESLVLTLEDETGVLLEPEQWFAVTTVADLAREIEVGLRAKEA